MFMKNCIPEKKTLVKTSCECSCGCGCSCDPNSAEKNGFKSVLKGSMRYSSKKPELLSK